MPRPARSVLAGLVAAGAATTACMVPVFAPGTADRPGSPVAPGSAVAPAAWRACPDLPVEVVGRAAPGMRYDCATVAVPQDWNAPGGAAFQLSLVRIRAERQTDRIGSLVVNPGGPGVSGVDAAVALSFGPDFGGIPADVTRRFDIVGFDPRGVARSSPIDCITDEQHDATFGADPDPDTPAEFAEQVTLNQRIGQACGAKYGERLPLFSTEQAARDLDAVRAAVGDDKLSYLGYSYGTLLGATYAQLFPRRIRALVLDGAVDPRQNLVAGSQAQARGFERAFDNFAAWCDRSPANCPIAPDAEAALTRALAAAENAPARGDDGREATPGWISVAVISSLYTEAGWRRLADAVADLRAGDPAGIFRLADSYADRDPQGRYSNLFDAFVAVSCADAAQTLTVAQVRALRDRWRREYPLFGAGIAMTLLPCVFWPGERDPYPTGPAVGAPPIMVVGTTGDPATPYENTAALARMLGVGRVLTWEGEGHTAYPNTTCVTAAVNAYLLDLQLPPEDLRCPAR